MSGNTIFETHKKFLLINTLVGYSAPEIPYYPPTLHLFLKYLNLMVISILLFSTVIITGGLSDPENTMEQACSTAILCFTLFISTFSSFYIYYTSDRFNSIISLMNDLTMTFMNDPLGNSHFREKLNSQYNMIVAYSVVNVVCTSIAAIDYILPMYLQSFKSLGFSGEMDLPFKLLSPIDYYKSPAYDIAFCIEMFAISVSPLKKLLSEVLIIALLHILSLFLQHLKYSFNLIFSEIDGVNCDAISSTQDKIIGNEESHNDVKVIKSNRLQLIKVKPSPKEVTIMEEEIQFQKKSTGSVSNINYELEEEEEEERNKKIAVVEEKLKQWAILHQDVLKLCSEVNRFLDPILTVYMCCITAAITLAAFTFTMGFAQTFVQIASTLFYYMACMLSLYLLCHMGHSVAYESATTADAALYTKWYNTNKNITNELKIILQRVKTPVLMTAFHSPNFELSKGTFLVFVKSTISFYLALIELQKRQETKSN